MEKVKNLLQVITMTCLLLRKKSFLLRWLLTTTYPIRQVMMFLCSYMYAYNQDDDLQWLQLLL